MPVENLNPNHPVTRVVSEYATQLTSLIVHKLGGHVVLTRADIDAACATTEPLALKVEERDDGLHLTIVNITDARALARKEGGLPS